jgi:hypothetical protein
LQSASATLAAAISSVARQPVVRAVIDWLGAASSAYDDLSANVESVSVNRSFTTDLPAEAQLVSGSTSAEATIELGGDVAGAPVGHLLNPFQSYLAGARKVTSPVELDLGFVTEAGQELLPVLRGKVRTWGAGPDRTLSLAAGDGAELLNQSVTLYTRLGVQQTFSQHGMSTTAILIGLLYQHGYYVDLPPIAGARVAGYWPLRGTVHPVIVGIDYQVSIDAYGGGRGLGVTSTFAGRFGWTAGPTPSSGLAKGTHDFGDGDLATLVDGRTSQVYPHFEAEANVESDFGVWAGRTLLVEWARMRVTNLGFGAVAAYPFDLWGTSAPSPANGHSNVNGSNFHIGITPDGRVFCYLFRQDATSASAQTPAGSVPEGFDGYLGVHFTLDSGGADVRVRIGSTTHTLRITLTLPTTFAASGGNTRNLSVPAQFQPEPSASVPVIGAAGFMIHTGVAYSAGIWRDAYEPTAVVDPGSPLVMVPPVEDQPAWQVVQDIAAAEAGAFIVDEAGRPCFYNRDRLATPGTAVKTVGADLALKGGAVADAVDAVRNIVTVKATVPVVAPVPNTGVPSIVWELSEKLSVASGETKVIPVGFDKVAIGAPSLGLEVFYYPTAGDMVYRSGYRAAVNADGTGGDVSNLEVEADVYPTRAEIRVHNPNAYTVWLVDNSLDSTNRGNPMLKVGLWAATLTEENGLTARAADDTSRADYGDQPVELPGTPWRQSIAAAEGIAAIVLSRTKDPNLVLTGVDAVGDPRVQLADQVTIIDTQGLGFARDFQVVGYTRRFDASGLADAYTVREVGHATTGMTGIFTLDDPLLGVLDGLNGLG